MTQKVGQLHNILQYIIRLSSYQMKTCKLVHRKECSHYKVKENYDKHKTTEKSCLITSL